VDAGESQGLDGHRIADDLGLTINPGPASAKLAVTIEKQLPGTLASLNCERRKRLTLLVCLDHKAKINRAEYVHVVQEKRLVFAQRSFSKKPGSFLYTAAGIQQHFFTGDFNTHSEIVFRFQILNHHVREMVDVDDHLTHTERPQACKSYLEQ